MGTLSFRRQIMLLAVVACAALSPFAQSAIGQRPRFPDFFQAQTPAAAIPVQSTQPFVFPGGVNQVGPVAPPPATIVAPAFDPFGAGTQPLPFNSNPTFGAANTAPTIVFPPQNVEVLPPGQPAFFDNPPNFFNTQPSNFGQSFFGFNQPQAAGQNFPRSGQTGQFLSRFRSEFLPRLLERPRVRHTYLPGTNGNELQIHDTEIATTLTLPRFLFLEQPLRITPGFIAHFWDGPETLGPFGTGFDLPETAFSGFLSSEYVTDPSRRAGLESNVTVGVYSDYEHLDSDSLRLTGVGLGWFRLNETNVFKIGVEYFDRLEVKILPAFGLFIRPTSDLQLDLYFPRPRIAQRLPNFRALQTWMYLAGEYGGGNWTVERDGGLDDRIDINDYRAIVGIEWISERGVTSFIETGYVFDRELISAAEIPSRRLDLQDTIMIRIGLEF